ncbi:hypothetical protein JG688_00005601 [Phytophthora aleatoria]|uniref:Uncharacterized protein n=1 Tax=Phytophthora aleatoria TaxID=2496075 RepID=A0A8J5IRP1_9STRA|nr:hypothetical protein JG688_00005601 [Phytophthora aleatoria]
MSSMSASSDICGIDVQALYLNDPGNKQEPVGYVLCSEMGNTCMKNGCSCRSAANAEVNGTTKYFGVCVVIQKGKDCVTSGDDYLTCAVSSETSNSVTESQNESSVTRSSTNTMATTESNATPSASTNASSSGAGNTVTVKSTAVSSDSMSTTVMVVIIVVAVVFVALVSWVIRSYCMRRSSAKGKLASNRNRSHHSTNFEATSPTNMTGRSSATPSFPAFDRRTRAMQSPTTTSGRSAGRSGRNTPRSRETNSSRGRNTPRSRETNSSRGRRNQDIDAQFAPGGPRDVTGEPASGRGRKNPDNDAPFPPLGGPRREPTSGRGRRNPDNDAPFPPLGGPRREPTSGRGRKTPDAQFAPNGPRGIREPGREPTSGRGRRDNGYQADAAMRTPPKQPSRPAPTNGPQPSGGTVYTGRNTYERVAQFAQLAAFEAPPPPPPRPQKAIKPVPVSDPVPKIARAPPPARPAPKRPAFHIPDDPLPTDYDILSPKTARSLAPSVASSATTSIVVFFHGYSLEIEIFKATQYTMECFESLNYGYIGIVTATDLKVSKYGIVNRFAFDPACQRSSVVVQEILTDKRFSFVKGSPEAVNAISITSPPDLKHKTLSYSADGYYCIGFGVKELNPNVPIDVNNREEVESAVEFEGLALFKNELKPETKSMLDELYVADIDIRVITGDNALTAVHVCRELEMKRNVAVVDVDEHIGSTAFVFVDDVMKSDLIQRSSFNENNMDIVLAEYDLAITGTALDKLQLDYGLVVGMCGDCTNDCGALKAAHVGLALSSAEAAIVAPFTSKAKAITNMPMLIREGRCALTTSFSGFKYMALYPIIQLGKASVLAQVGTWADVDIQLTDNQYLWDDLSIVLPLALCMLYTGPSKSLSRDKPPSTLLSLKVVASIAGHLVIFCCILRAGI